MTIHLRFQSDEAVANGDMQVLDVKMHRTPMDQRTDANESPG